MSPARPISVAFVHTHPIQYFAPLYRKLNEADDLNVTGLYLSDISVRGGFDLGFGRNVRWDIDLVSGYDVHFVPDAARRIPGSSFFSIVAPQIMREIRTREFDAIVVHGHSPAAMLVAVAAAKSLKIPTLMRCETHLGLKRSPLKSALRRCVLGGFYRTMDGFLAIGSANHSFYRAMGVPEKRIFSMPYAVDNARFVSADRSAHDRCAWRARIGVEDDYPIVLYAAKFQKRKRPNDLIRASALLAKEGVMFHLVMVGAGEMEAELRALASGLPPQRTHFLGFVNQRELPEVYAASDIFVLPSDDEPWGLAINEAMCAGLPVVASKEIGCVPDLVRDGINGRTFAAGDIEGLTRVLRPLLEEEGIRGQMAIASRRIISHWSYAECADGLRAALASLGLVSSRQVETAA